MVFVFYLKNTQIYEKSSAEQNNKLVFDFDISSRILFRDRFILNKGVVYLSLL